MEIWKSIPSQPKYEASSLGRIRRIVCHCCGARPGRTLKPRTTNRGFWRYPVVAVSTRRISVHMLVAEAFLGKRPKGFIVNHKDTNKENSSADNLEYVTYSTNNFHAYATGKRQRQRGEDASNSVLSERQVLEIAECNQSAADAAYLYGVTAPAINAIREGRSWSWLTGIKREEPKSWRKK